MKLCCLNIYGGKYFEPLINYIVSESADTDFFCFQEVFDTNSNRTSDGEARVNILSECKKILPNFTAYFVSVEDNFNYFTKRKVVYPLSVGMAMFVRKTISVVKHEAPFIHGAKNSIERGDLSTFPKVLQTLTYSKNGEHYTIFNIHGPWTSGFKGDNDRTLRYFERVKESLDATPEKKILCGDFNINPDTKSIMLVEEGMRNLIREYQITTTRSTLYAPHVSPFADYVFVSSDIAVHNFSVPNITISDHLPLLLEFS